MTTELSRPSSSASARNLRSRSLSSRSKRKTRTQTTRKSENVEQRTDAFQTESRSDQGRLKILLENLDIRFIDCTFTYKQSHYDDAMNSTSASKRRSKLSALRNTIFKMREAITFEKTFDQCLYVPTDEKDKIKDFILTNFSDVKLSFQGCKFIKRSSTFSEKIAQRFRKMFGIMFELEYINSTATINSSTFRVKDILFINQHIQERIVEEG